ncbi:MAG: peptide chain release factor N(5)-glutamine methyltransferase [Verrucomicrobiota bacterium]
MTVLEGIQKSADFLTKKGVDSPRLQAELLLAHVLQLPRMKLYLNFERALTDSETDTLRELVRRRGQREPLQHIVGSTSFCGFEMAVNPHVLVPRPETELLAEEGWKFLSMITAQAATALDFGTGSGCIAIALAAKCPAAKICALDVSESALKTARENATRNHVADRIQFLQGDGFSALPPAPDNALEFSAVFDLIISNPPYIASAEIETLDPEVRDHDPRSALDGGADGLDFYRRLAIEARPFLKANGRIMVEFGDAQGEAVKKIFEAQKWVVEAIRDDYTQRQRILIARL